jgi:hypothetical protein
MVTKDIQQLGNPEQIHLFLWISVTAAMREWLLFDLSLRVIRLVIMGLAIAVSE